MLLVSGNVSINKMSSQKIFLIDNLHNAACHSCNPIKPSHRVLTSWPETPGVDFCRLSMWNDGGHNRSHWSTHDKDETADHLWTNVKRRGRIKIDFQTIDTYNITML